MDSIAPKGTTEIIVKYQTDKVISFEETFVLPQYVVENKYCIEIIYGNNKLIKNIE
jgi:hypothetical protein